MDEIGKIIYNCLLSRNPVWLPCIGTFRTDYLPARNNGDGTVAPPHNSVVFIEGEQAGALPITDYIVPEPDGDTPQVKYDRWLVKATERGPVVIEGIGVVNNGIFTPYESLLEALNPVSGPATGAVRPAGKKGLGKNEKIWLVLIAVFILILVGGWTWWHKYYTAPAGHDKWNTHNPAATDNLDVIPESTGALPDNIPDENVGIVEAGTIVEPVEVETSPVVTPVPTVSGAGHYVVGGVFSTQENADKYIRQMSAKYPDLDYKQHPYPGAKIMVSLGGGTDRNEANRERRRIENKISEYDLWVYEVK